MKKLVTGCYAAMLVLSAALPAAASHAAPPRYVTSEPPDGATVHEPPDEIEATFDQPLDQSSRLVVRDECGRRVDDRTTDVDANKMSTTLTKKPSGQYHVDYTAVGIGGVTGTGTGHFSFTAHGGKPCDGGSNQHDHHGGNEEKHANHGNNERHPGGGHDGTGDHDEHSMTGPSGDHDAHASGSGDATHDDHDAAAGGDHKGHAKHGAANDDVVASGDIPGITSQDDTSRRLLGTADSATLLLSLGLCAALGVLGGAILRATAARSPQRSPRSPASSASR